MKNKIEELVVWKAGGTTLLYFIIFYCRLGCGKRFPTTFYTLIN